MSQSISETWHPGDFPMDKRDWLLTQSDLRVAEQVLTDVSAGTDWQVLGNIRTDWPARRLRRRRGLGIEEIRVLLAHRFDAPEDRAYLLDRVSVVGFWLWRREGKHVKGPRLSAAEVADAALVRANVLQMMNNKRSDRR